MSPWDMAIDLENDLEVSYDATAELRREAVDVYNRLHSIDEDAQFVSSVAAAYTTLPLLPNLRCGAWYTDPQKSAAEPVYFKSTDGHFGQWAFNLRRANLHLLALVEQRGGVILVDSTRRGKRLPDALAKTVPIWCAVINCAISRRFYEGQWRTELFTPPSSVSASEHDQIQSHIEGWANELLGSQYTLPRLARPLRPFWVTPSTTMLPARAGDGDAGGFFPIICVSASKLAGDEALDRRSGYTYVQGSGDDHELWSQGLTPRVYWKHRDALLSASRAALPELIASLLSSTPARAPSEHAAAVPASPIRQVSGRIWVGALPVAWEPGSDENDMVLLRLPCAADAASESPGAGESSDARTIPVVQGKKGQFHFMNTVLPQGCAFARAQLAAGKRVCIACADGKDVSVGVALAVLQLSFDDTGHLVTAAVPQATKDSIRKRLQWVLESCPGANPTRTTLKRVHEFLMSPSPRSMPVPRDPPQ